jgi:hypothetical protein
MGEGGEASVSGYDKEKLAKLIDVEYERTAKFIDGVSSTTATIRGWAVTIWLAVIGVAFSQSTWELAGLAAVVALVFLVIDGYHAWLYGEALARANELERLSGAYYDSFGRLAGDNDAETDLRVRLETHVFGLYRNFKRFRPRDLWFVRPWVFFRLFYPLLVVIGVGAAFFIASSGEGDPPTCKLIENSRPQAIQCGERVIIGGKSISILPTDKSE